MDLIILSKTDIVSKKDGRAWVKLFALTKKGEVLDIFLSKDEYIALGFSAVEKSFVTKEDIDGLFKEYTAVKVAFDNRGRVSSVELQ